MLTLLIQAALAADGDPFVPATSLANGTGTLQGESPILGEAGPSVAVDFSVARDLVVFDYADGSGESPILAQATALEFVGGWTIADTLRIDLSIPTYAFVNVPWKDWQGPAMGDLRVQSTIPFGPRSEALSLGVIPRIGLPTGTRNAYVRRGFSGGATLSATGQAGSFGWLANGGLTLSPSDEIEGITTGSTFDLLGGLFVTPIEGFRLGAETDLSLGLAHGRTGQGNARSTGHLFAQVLQPSGLGLTAGAGTGLLGGVGAPEWRLFAALSWTAVVRDRDKDGILDADDQCIVDPEDVDSFQDDDGCPEIDNDKDGLADLADTCPNDPEDPDGFDDGDGCPDLDNDKDGVPDTTDMCPVVPGLPEFLGCPDTDKDGLPDAQDQCPEDPGPIELMGCPDRDSDQVPDFRDRCPTEPKPVDEDPATSDGCPKRVYITATNVRILDKVFFETAKATIKPESYSLLNDVADVLSSHPELIKVEVGGHTDDQGSTTYNDKLSQSRSQSVVDYLVKKGIAADRLSAHGYGESTPIDSNKTGAGRANNRRVEFKILDRRQTSSPLPGVPVPAVPGTTPTPAPTGPTPWSPTGPAPTGPATPPPGSPWGGDGAAPATPTPAAPEAPKSTAPAGTPGKLTVVVIGVGWADVYVDNERVSRTAPFTDLEIAAGHHTIEVVNAREGLTYKTQIDVEPGQSVKVEAKKAEATMPWGPDPGFAPWSPPTPPPDGGSSTPWK